MYVGKAQLNAYGTHGQCTCAEQLTEGGWMSPLPRSPPGGLPSPCAALERAFTSPAPPTPPAANARSARADPHAGRSTSVQYTIGESRSPSARSPSVQ